MNDFEKFDAEVQRLEEHLDDPANAVHELDGFQFGERVRVIEDDEDNGIFAGDEGDLILEEVGAVEYGSQRVMACIVQDGMGPMEISTDNIEGA